MLKLISSLRRSIVIKGTFPSARAVSKLDTFLSLFIPCALLGAISTWRLWEQDIYWQIRAGAELFSSKAFPLTDSWSYTSTGRPWINIQWLATLLFAGLYELGSEPLLILARAILTTLLLSLIAHYAWRHLRTRLNNRAATIGAGLVVFLYYIALYPRIQLRSDFLVAIVFTTLLSLPLWIKDKQLRARVAIAGVWLASNLHFGTAPFVLLAAIALLPTYFSWRQRFYYSALYGLAFLATPYHVRALPLLWQHVAYSAHNIMENPDHQALSAAYFSSTADMGAGWAWLLILGCSAAYSYALWCKGPQIWRRALAPAALWLLFFALSVDRLRAIPYHALLSLPAVCWTARLLLQRWPQPVRLTGLAAALGLSVWLAAAHAPRLGLNAESASFPIGSTRFIAQHKPQGNLLHTFAYGAYLVWHLQDYPLFADTRETMFWHLQRDVLQAYHSAEVTQSLIERYRVNTVLMPIPQTAFAGEGEQADGYTLRDLIEEYLPRQEWALVHFDQISFVAVRRLPEHQALIAAHEYKWLRPNLPANLLALSYPKLSAELRDEYQAEIDRCLQSEPTASYCAVAKLAWLYAKRDNQYVRSGWQLLMQAQTYLSPKHLQNRITFYLEKRRFLKHIGETRMLAKLEEQLSRQ